MTALKSKHNLRAYYNYLTFATIHRESCSVLPNGVVSASVVGATRIDESARANSLKMLMLLSTQPLQFFKVGINETCVVHLTTSVYKISLGLPAFCFQ